MRKIKKYSNRRLYDTEESRYVNLEELARLIRAGEEITVVDVSSGDDLTRQVLLQVLVETQGGDKLFPPGLMHRIIRFSGDSPLHRAALQQVGAGLEILDAQVRQLERNLGLFPGAAGMGAAGMGAAGMGAAGMGAPPTQKTTAPPPRATEAPPTAAEPAPEWDVDPPADAAPPEPPPAASDGDADGGLDALRARLAALEARLKG